jgi:hypothetical protein
LSFLHSITPSLLGPNITLSTMFSNPVNLFALPLGWDQISYPYKTAAEIRILCVMLIIFMALDSRREGRVFWSEWQQTFP